MSDLYTKMAAPRWLTKLRGGLVGLGDRLRLGGGTLVSPTQMRTGLQEAATTLAPEQLERNLRLKDLLMRNKIRHEGGELHNAVMTGPATSGFGQVLVSPQAGTLAREMAEHQGKVSRGLLSGWAMSGRDLPEGVYRRMAKPEDRGIFHAIGQHEFGERAMLRAQHAEQYPGNPFASHLGPTADLAERIGVQDPRVHRAFDALRQTLGKDDPRAFRLLRQHGVVAGNAPPLGGRAARSLEKRIEKMETSAIEGGQRRLDMGAQTHLPKEDWGAQERVTRLGDRIAPYMPEQVRENWKNLRATMPNRAEAEARPSRFNWQDPEQVRRYIANFSAV